MGFAAVLKLKHVKDAKAFYISTPPTPAEFRKAAARVALCYVIIHKCNDCKWPTIEGYCCTYCGSVSP